MREQQNIPISMKLRNIATPFVFAGITAFGVPACSQQQHTKTGNTENPPVTQDQTGPNIRNIGREQQDILDANYGAIALQPDSDLIIGSDQAGVILQTRVDANERCWNTPQSEKISKRELATYTDKGSAELKVTTSHDGAGKLCISGDEGTASITISGVNGFGNSLSR